MRMGLAQLPIRGEIGVVFGKKGAVGGSDLRRGVVGSGGEESQNCNSALREKGWALGRGLDIRRRPLFRETGQRS